MPKRLISVALGVLFSLALSAAVVRADSANSERLDGSLHAVDNMSLHLPDISRADEHSAIFTGFQSNNGKHPAFSVTAIHRGPQLGIVRPNAPTVTQNPEPATML